MVGERHTLTSEGGPCTHISWQPEAGPEIAYLPKFLTKALVLLESVPIVEAKVLQHQTIAISLMRSLLNVLCPVPLSHKRLLPLSGVE